MANRILPCLLLLAFCASASIADYIDGYITAGEYEYFVEWTSNDPPLIVDGGGADIIEARGYASLEVLSTSLPLGIDQGGVYDILLDDFSELLYLDGSTDLISVYDNASAIFKGGKINYIRSFQLVGEVGNITIECLDGWSWMESSGDIFGIAGQWAGGASFDIEFIDQTDIGYDPVWENINVVVVPEPATLLLISTGAIILRKRRK